MKGPVERVAFAGIGLAFGLGNLGCSVPVAQALEETVANRVVAALEQQGISTEKTPDREAEGRWAIEVARHQASSATALLAREGLPPKNSIGVLDALGGSTVLPSRLNEHARWVAGTAGELEQSLQGLDGVVSARVHLAVPVLGGYLAVPAPASGSSEPSASVLLRHRGAKPPLPVSDVQRLVAGAVTGLMPERVSVVVSQAPAADPGATRVARATSPLAWALPAWFSGAMALIGAACLGVALTYRAEARRFRTAAAETAASKDGAGL